MQVGISGGNEKWKYIFFFLFQDTELVALTWDQKTGSARLFIDANFTSQF